MCVCVCVCVYMHAYMCADVCVWSCPLVVYLFSIEVDVSAERSSGAREGEHRQWDRNRNIDTNLVCVEREGRREGGGGRREVCTCDHLINLTTM